MRIFHVSWEYPPVIYGGLGRHVLALTRAQAAAGHDVTVITQRPADTPTAQTLDGVCVVRTRTETPPVRRDVAGLMHWTADLDEQLAATVSALDCEPPEVVHVHDWVVERAARAAGKRWPAPVVATIHATEAGRHAGWIVGDVSESVYAAEWRLARRATAVITCSVAMAAEAIALYELAPERVLTIPNGIDLARWSAQPTVAPAGTYCHEPDAPAAPTAHRPGNRQRRDDPVRDGLARPTVATTAPTQNPTLAANPVVLFVGRLEWEKGVQVLIEAVKLLPDEPSVDVLIAGVGTQADRFGKLAADETRVRFMGQVSDAELRQLLSNAAVVVVPSLYEPFGIVALEAAAAGAALIVSDVGGLAEIVTSSVTGLSVPPNQPAALAAAITAVLADPASARLRAARLRAQLPEIYSWDRIAERTVAVYRAARTMRRAAPVPLTATAPQSAGQLLDCGW